MNDNLDSDIIVVGAGLAGVTAASALGKRWRVTLIDPRSNYPPVFKAEKIEPEQAALFRKFGLMHLLETRARPIREIKTFYKGDFRKSTPTEQYGLPYAVMVNTLRSALPDSVHFRQGRVMNIANSADLQHVTLDNGQRLSCRLVVLACGLSRDLLPQLQMRRVWIQKHQSMAVAFTLRRMDGMPFLFDTITYTLSSSVSGIDYVSLFPIEQGLRANLFAFPARDNSWLQAFVQELCRELPRIIPKLSRAIGEHKVTGKVEMCVINLYLTEGAPPDGVVLIGDAAQNVCPSTGMGLTKIFTDLDVLCSECVPEWFETPGMGSDKTQMFFRHPGKVAADKKALQDAYYRRHACAARSLKWRIHRTKLHLSMRLGRS